MFFCFEFLGGWPWVFFTLCVWVGVIFIAGLSGFFSQGGWVYVGLWRSLKYEYVYLNAFETSGQVLEGIGSWPEYYNHERPHSTFDGHTPHETYNGIVNPNLAA